MLSWWNVVECTVALQEAWRCFSHQPALAWCEADIYCTLFTIDEVIVDSISNIWDAGDVSEDRNKMTIAIVKVKVGIFQSI